MDKLANVDKNHYWQMWIKNVVLANVDKNQSIRKEIVSIYIEQDEQIYAIRDGEQTQPNFTFRVICCPLNLC